jgi:hypothetical protein
MLTSKFHLVSPQSLSRSSAAEVEAALGLRVRVEVEEVVEVTFTSLTFVSMREIFISSKSEKAGHRETPERPAHLGSRVRIFIFLQAVDFRAVHPVRRIFLNAFPALTSAQETQEEQVEVRA